VWGRIAERSWGFGRVDVNDCVVDEWWGRTGEQHLRQAERDRFRVVHALAWRTELSRLGDLHVVERSCARHPKGDRHEFPAVQGRTAILSESSADGFQLWGRLLGQLEHTGVEVRAVYA
jgi:hypothetical protein